MAEMEAAVEKKPAIVFIDDDLRPPRFAMLPEVLRNTLSDINSPDLATLWGLGQGLLGLPAFQSISSAEVQRRVQEDDFVVRVLLSREAYAAVSDGIRPSLDGVRAHRESILVFGESVRKAFPEATFQRTELAERPADKRALLAADLLILDLVMGGGNPVDGIKEFLDELATQAGDSTIPPILLVSLHDDMLRENHLEIRSGAHISASGLFVLSKADISTPTGHFMLTALWSQLNERREAAQKMRVFCLAMNAAFSTAREKTMRTLWSLDVASMHQIYVTARTENDSYSEHVLELLGREVAWHFEANDAINDALGKLKEEFASSIKESDSKPEIKFRYPSFVGLNVEALRTLVNHHSCTPLLPQSAVTDLNPVENPWGMPGVLPFGAVVLSNKFDESKEVFINITPQCDLIKKKLISNNLSLTFVTARAHPALVKSNYGSAVMVFGVSLEGRDCDLEVFPDRTLSYPVQQLLELAKPSGWSVKARLRADVAKQIQQEIASHLSRRDALSVTHGRVAASRVCIKIGQTVLWYPDGVFAQSADVLVTNTGTSRHHILDQDAFLVATWAAKTLAEKIGADPFGTAGFVNQVCNVLQMGLDKDQPQTVSDVQFKVGSHPLAAMEGQLGGAAVPRGAKALLLVLISRDA